MTYRHHLRASFLAVVLLAPTAALAQSTPNDRLEVGAGLGWFGPMRFAPVSATETSPGGGRRTLFTTNSEFETSPGVDVRIGVRLTSRLQVESSIALNAARLSTHISDDVESAADTTASQPVTQYLIEGGLVVHLSRWRSGRTAPFATAGVGYVRHVNDGQTLVETGRSFYVGGGAHYLLKSEGTGRLKSAGLRADIRATILENGVALDAAKHLAPFIGAGLFLRF